MWLALPSQLSHLLVYYVDPLGHYDVLHHFVES